MNTKLNTIKITMAALMVCALGSLHVSASTDTHSPGKSTHSQSSTSASDAHGSAQGDSHSEPTSGHGEDHSSTAAAYGSTPVAAGYGSAPAGAGHGGSSEGHGAAAAGGHAAAGGSSGFSGTLLYGFGALVVILALGLIYYQARTTDQNGRTKLKLTFGAKLIASFAVILIAMTALSIYASSSMKKIGEEIAELAEEIIPVTSAIVTIETHQLEQAIILERAFRFGEEQGAHAAQMFEVQIRKFRQFAKQVDREIQETTAPTSVNGS